MKSPAVQTVRPGRPDDDCAFVPPCDIKESIRRGWEGQLHQKLHQKHMPTVKQMWNPEKKMNRFDGLPVGTWNGSMAEACAKIEDQMDLQPRGWGSDLERYPDYPSIGLGEPVGAKSFPTYKALT